MDDLTHIYFDIFNVFRYVFSNIATLFGILFTPLTWFFNFLKGFFNGISTPPPETSYAWTFPANILAVFNSIPHFSTICWACGAGLSILVLIFIFRRLVDF